jgi:Lipocalin-like domain
MRAFPVSLALIGVATFTFNVVVNAADIASSPVGTWRITDYSLVTLETNEVSNPYPNPIGYLQYSPGGHMVVFLQKGNPEKPPSAAFPDAYRADIHKGIFGAYAGTYTVEGNKITHHVVASWRPDWISGDQVRYAEITGNKLTIKTAPVIFSQTGKQIVSTLTFERIE